MNDQSSDFRRIAPEWGDPLTAADYASLETSWITRDVADHSMLRRVDAQRGREIIGQKGSRDCSGILIPNYWPGETRPRSYTVRRDNPEYRTDKDGNVKPDRKYMAEVGRSNLFYIPPGITPEQLQDTSIPILMLEGHKKALAAMRLATHDSDRLRFIPIALAGVWNHLGTTGKANNERGERVDVKGPIPDFDRIEWNGRTAIVSFDSNVNTNPSVKAARGNLARILANRHAIVQYVTLPEDCGVNGIDDLLAIWGPEKVLALFDERTDAARITQIMMSAQFVKRENGMFRVVQQRDGELQETQLTNFQAAVIASITLDDGVQSKGEFEIEANLLGRHLHFSIESSAFGEMNWPIEKMGPTAITFPRQKEYARTAIQWFSMELEEHHVYTHTGWRQIDGVWLYCHAAGAIGAAGNVASVKVSLPGSLSRFALRLPADPSGLIVAVRASLRLVELGPPEVSFPLRAATFRAIFGGCDFSIHVVGATGAYKSERCALEQQHFGADMNRTNLPASWSSTANALEMCSFLLKDTAVVVDDYAPQGSPTDLARYQSTAARLFRAVGNQSGRGRLDSSASLREAKPPRALILSTGEDIPSGHSIRARLLILEVVKGDISTLMLTECQRAAAAGLYAEAMGAFIRWVAADYEAKQSALAARIKALRLRAMQGAQHARTPEMVASLQAGFEVLLQFAQACGAVDAAERVGLESRCWNALVQSSHAQAKHQGTSEPAAHFVALIRTVLASGRGHLAGRDGKEPAQTPEACGYRRSDYRLWPQGDCIGWVDGDDVYLESTASYRAAQAAGRETSEMIPVGEQVLRKRLKEKGFLVSVDTKRETLTVRRTCSGSMKDVLHFSRDVVLPSGPDFPDNEDLGERGSFYLEAPPVVSPATVLCGPDVRSLLITGNEMNDLLDHEAEHGVPSTAPRSGEMAGDASADKEAGRVSGSTKNPTAKPDIRQRFVI
jgi:hypothetical protein